MCFWMMWWVAASVTAAEELYDDAGGYQQAETVDYDDAELYQDAGDTRGYAPSQGVCARALYDYQAGQ